MSLGCTVEKMETFAKGIYVGCRERSCRDGGTTKEHSPKHGVQMAEYIGTSSGHGDQAQLPENFGRETPRSL